MIDIEVFAHTEVAGLDLEKLTLLANRAVPLILPHPGPEGSSLEPLTAVEVSLVDDAAIAQVHADFLDDPTATDVITFHHGELIVSTETAARQAAALAVPFFQETLLYIVHGLLHLHGHEDATPAGAATMADLQTRIVTQLTTHSF